MGNPPGTHFRKREKWFGLCRRGRACLSRNLKISSEPTIKGEIPAIAPKFSLIAAFPRAGQASPSPTAELERRAFGRRVGEIVTLQGNGLPRRCANRLAMTGNYVTLRKRLVAALGRAVKSDAFLTACRKNCHCEPVTDVTGVAIRIQMGNPSQCAEILPDRSIPPRGTGKPVPYGGMGRVCRWSEGGRNRNIAGERIATPVCAPARNDRFLDSLQSLPLHRGGF